MSIFGWLCCKQFPIVLLEPNTIFMLSCSFYFFEVYINVTYFTSWFSVLGGLLHNGC